MTSLHPFSLMLPLLVACASTAPHQVVSLSDGPSPFRECELQQWKEGYSAQVRECFIHAVDRYPESPQAQEAYAIIAASYYYGKDFKSARYYLDILHRVFPNSPFIARAILLEVRMALAEGKLDQAATSLATLSNPKSLADQDIRDFYRLKAELEKRKSATMEYLLTLTSMVHLPQFSAEKEKLRVEIAAVISTASSEALTRTVPSLPPFPKEEVLARLTAEQCRNAPDQEACKAKLRENGFGENSTQKKEQGANPPKRPPVAALATAVATAGSSDALKPSDPPDLRKIGILLPLSGKFSLYGSQALKGIFLALDTYAEYQASPPIELVIRDTGGEEKDIDAAIEELAHREKVTCIIGPIRKNTTLRAAQLADKAGIPLIALTPDEEVVEVGPAIHHLGVSKSQQAKALVSFAVQKLGIRNFGIFYPRHAYGREFLHIFWDEVEAQGADVTAVEDYDPEMSDFKQQLLEMVGSPRAKLFKDDLCTPDKVRKKLPCLGASRMFQISFEALFIPDSPINASYIIPNLFFYDIIGVQLLGPNAWNSDEFLQRIGVANGAEYIQGTLIADAVVPKIGEGPQGEFAEEYELVYGEQATALSATAYDAFRIVEHAIHASGVTTRADVAHALKAMSGFPGLTGALSFRDNRTVDRALRLLTVDQGSIVEFPKE